MGQNILNKRTTMHDQIMPMLVGIFSLQWLIRCLSGALRQEIGQKYCKLLFSHCSSATAVTWTRLKAFAYYPKLHTVYLHSTKGQFY